MRRSRSSIWVVAMPYLATLRKLKPIYSFRTTATALLVFNAPLKSTTRWAPLARFTPSATASGHCSHHNSYHFNWLLTTTLAIASNRGNTNILYLCQSLGIWKDHRGTKTQITPHFCLKYILFILITDVKEWYATNNSYNSEKVFLFGRKVSWPVSFVCRRGLVDGYRIIPFPWKQNSWKASFLPHTL